MVAPSVWGEPDGTSGPASTPPGTTDDVLRYPFFGVTMERKHCIPTEAMQMIVTHSDKGDEVQRTIKSTSFHHADFVDPDVTGLMGEKFWG